MGSALGMSGRKLEYLIIGAGLHDIGKILVPEEILHHNRPLSESEFSIVKQHPLLGYKVARSLKYHPAIQDIILHHHERPDGKGYPDRLKGRAITQSAMIVHIVDVYDALCAKRPYRPAFKPSDAIGIMYAESGTGLDKKLLRLFLDKVLKDKKHATR